MKRSVSLVNIILTHNNHISAETKFTHAISSDLCRALKTGQTILDKNPSLDTHNIETWSVLRERSFGEFEGQPASKMMDYLKELDKGEVVTWGPPGGESGVVFRERVRQFLGDLGEKVCKIETSDESGLRFLVTSHGGFIKELNMVLVKEHKCGMPCKNGEYGRISPNTGVSKYEISFDDAGAVVSVNCSLLYCRDHLQDMEYKEPLHYGV